MELLWYLLLTPIISCSLSQVFKLVFNIIFKYVWWFKQSGIKCSWILFNSRFYTIVKLYSKSRCTKASCNHECRKGSGYKSLYIILKTSKESSIFVFKEYKQKHIKKSKEQKHIKVICRNITQWKFTQKSGNPRHIPHRPGYNPSRNLSQRQPNCAKEEGNPNSAKNVSNNPQCQQIWKHT